MNEMDEPDIPQSLRPYRGQLREAVARDLDARQRRGSLVARLRRRPLVALSVGAAALAVAVAVVLATSPSAPVSSADAAILHAVAAALTPPAGTVLHEKETISLPGQPAPQSFELWAQADPLYGVTCRVGPDGSPVRGYHFNSSATGPAVHSPDADRAPLDAAATLRALVQSGNASVVGTTTIDGVAAYELQVSGAPDATLDGTAYVAQSDYQPLLIQTTNGETITYLTYEYLPHTSASPSPAD